MDTPCQIPRRKPLQAKIGLMAVGHHVYWPQFPGLREEMERKKQVLAQKIRQTGVELIDFGMADEAISAAHIARDIEEQHIDLLFIHMATYATSATIAPIFRLRHLPMVMVALQPLEALDYANATTFMQLCNDDVCAMPEFAGIALRMGRRVPELIIGTENDTQADQEIIDYCAIARALHDLRHARIGHMGHVLEGMLDMHTDPAAITAAFGCHVVQCEPDEIMHCLQTVSAEETEAMKQRILSFFATPDPGSDPVTERLTESDLQNAAEIAVALEKFINNRRLDGLAYYYEGEEGSPMRTLVTNLIVGNSLLIAAGFPMCGEFDLKTCIAMLIMDRLGIGGSFAEFHPVDFQRGTILVGHDGPHHLNIADGRPVIRSLKKYHGKPGKGASVEFSIRRGPLTILSIGVGANGKFRFVVAEGESVPGPIPPTGNTNTHASFAPDIRTFLKRWIKAGPTHHFALGIGHKALLLEKIADFLDIDCIRVTP